MSTPIFKRVLLKLSGEALMGKQGLGIDPEVVNGIAYELKEVKQLGVEIGIVIGGGNIFHDPPIQVQRFERGFSFDRNKD